MPNAPDLVPLQLTIELAVPVDRRQVTICVHQYVSQLCEDLALPAAVLVLVRDAAAVRSQQEPFQITLDGKSFPVRMWPPLNFPKQPSAQDVADAIAFSLFEGRELLLTGVILDRIKFWCNPGGSETNGWSDASLDQFVRLFLRYNFSLNHARGYLQANPRAPTSEMEICCFFEHALEEAPDLLFGATVAVCYEEFEGHRMEYDTAFAEVSEGLDFDLALLCVKPKTQSGLLRPGEFQIRINDIRLPVIRGLARGFVILQDRSRADASGTEILFDPFSRDWLQCVRNSPDIASGPDGLPNGPAAYVKSRLKSILLTNAGCLVMSPLIRLLVDKVETVMSSLLSHVYTRFRTSQEFPRWFTSLLRCLLDEHVSIADLIGILESLLSLREVNRNRKIVGVYHFSQLEDSPIPIGIDKTVGTLSKGELVAAARLGVPSLTVRQQGDVRQPLAGLPLPGRMQKAILRQQKNELLFRWVSDQVLHLVTLQAVATHIAVVVDQHVRFQVSDRLRSFFPDIAVFGESEVPKALLAEGFNLLTQIYSTRGSYLRAIEAGRGAIAISPDTADHHARLAYASGQQANYVTTAARKQTLHSQAREEYQMAITLNPHVAWYHHYLGLAHSAMHFLNEACGSLRECIRLNPKLIVAYLDLAGCLSQLEQFDQVADLLKAALEIEPTSLPVKLALIKSYAQAAQFDEAVKLAQEASREEGANALVDTGLLSDLRNAQQVALQMKTSPASAALYSELGTIQGRLGNLRAAVFQYRQAISLDGATPGYHKLLGNALYKLDDWPGAASAWEMVRTLDGKDALNLNNLGTAYDALEQTELAKSCYEQAASLVPDAYVPPFNLGSSNYRLKNYTAAKDAYTVSSRLESKFPTTYLHIGNCHFRLNSPEEAVAAWLTVLQYDPKHVEARFNLGVALWSSPQKQSEAVVFWKEAFDLDANLTVAEDNLYAIALDTPPPHLWIFDLLHARGEEDVPLPTIH